MRRVSMRPCSMGGGFDEIRRATGFEQQSDIAFQLRLVALDREMIVRPLLDDIVGYRALGQQGIAGDVLAFDDAGLKQRNRHADFVGALLLITAFYWQRSHFFWA